jgi:hypothetical protein
MKGVLLGWLIVPVQEIFVLPWLPSSTQYKIFLVITLLYFTSFVPIAVKKVNDFPVL